MDRRQFCALMGTLGLTGFPVLAAAQSPEPLKVVTSFSILADMAARLGGRRIQVTSLVGPDADAHGFQPAPKHVRAVTEAAVIILNGMGFEGWMPRLKQAANSKARLVEATAGIKGREALEEDDAGAKSGHDHDHDHDHGPLDPHAWQSVANGRVYAKNIAQALMETDPAGKADYAAALAAYDGELAALDSWVKDQISAVPAAKRKIITNHDAFGYLGDAYGIKILPLAGLSTGKEPSAATLRRLTGQIKSSGVRALFLENVADPRLLEQLGQDTGAIIGGRLYSDALAAPGKGPASYSDLFKTNIPLLAAGMLQNNG